MNTSEHSNTPTESIASITPSYLSLKTGKASKTGQRSHGQIHYRILTDTEQQNLYITITGNDGGGYYSKEIIAFAKVERCLEGLNADKPLSSKIFQSAFVGQSSNNAGFLAAILRAEQLLAPVADDKHHYALQPNWAEWKTNLLALADKAEPFQPELPKPRFGKTASDKTALQNDDETESSRAETDAIEQSDTDAMQEQSTTQGNTDAENISIASVSDKHANKKQRTEKRSQPIEQESDNESAA
jgi:hypothetical protein